MQTEAAITIADSVFNHGSPCCSLMAKNGLGFKKAL